MPKITTNKKWPVRLSIKSKKGFIAGDKSMPIKRSEYNKIRTLGKGANGLVELVEYKDEQYAMKIASAKNQDAVNEISVWASVQDQACLRGVIPNMHLIFEQRGKLIIIMELIQGEEMMDMLMMDSIATKHKQAIALLLIDSVKKLHKCGVVHRDIKPENIVVNLSKDVNVALIDYGGACFRGEECKPTGTFNYMAPAMFQHYLGKSYLDDYTGEDWFVFGVNADIWSTALTCYVLFAMTLPGLYDKKTKKQVAPSSNRIAQSIATYLNSLDDNAYLTDFEWLIKIIAPISTGET